MPDDFFDTSALVKRHINETGSKWVRSLIRAKANHRIYIARITAAEVSAAITRRSTAATSPPPRPERCSAISVATWTSVTASST